MKFASHLVHDQPRKLRSPIRKPGGVIPRVNFLGILLPVTFAVPSLTERFQINLQIEIRLRSAAEKTKF